MQNVTLPVAPQALPSASGTATTPGNRPASEGGAFARELGRARQGGNEPTDAALTERHGTARRSAEAKAARAAAERLPKSAAPAPAREARPSDLPGHRPVDAERRSVPAAPAAPPSRASDAGSEATAEGRPVPPTTADALPVTGAGDIASVLAALLGLAPAAAHPPGLAAGAPGPAVDRAMFDRSDPRSGKAVRGAAGREASASAAGSGTAAAPPAPGDGLAAGRPRLAATTEATDTAGHAQAVTAWPGSAQAGAAADSMREQVTPPTATNTSGGTGSTDTAAPAAAGSALAPTAPPSSALQAGATASAPFEARLAAALGSPAFAPALGHQLSLLVRDGVQEARLHLNPAEMGPITVQIALEGQAAHVHLAAEQPFTREALEQAMPALASALREGGLTLTGGGVFEQPREPQQGAADDRPSRSASRGADDEASDGARAAPEAQRTLRGVVDLIA